jgi:hypothetical protein
MDGLRDHLIVVHNIGLPDSDSCLNSLDPLGLNRLDSTSGTNSLILSLCSIFSFHIGRQHLQNIVIVQPRNEIDFCLHHLIPSRFFFFRLIHHFVEENDKIAVLRNAARFAEGRLVCLCFLSVRARFDDTHIEGVQEAGFSRDRAVSSIRSGVRLTGMRLDIVLEGLAVVDGFWRVEGPLGLEDGFLVLLELDLLGEPFVVFQTFASLQKVEFKSLLGLFEDDEIV